MIQRTFEKLKTLSFFKLCSFLRKGRYDLHVQNIMRKIKSTLTTYEKQNNKNCKLFIANVRHFSYALRLCK